MRCCLNKGWPLSKKTNTHNKARIGDTIINAEKKINKSNKRNMIKYYFF
jgi:hypothetical protein